MIGAGEYLVPVNSPETVPHSRSPDAPLGAARWLQLTVALTSKAPIARRDQLPRARRWREDDASCAPLFSADMIDGSRQRTPFGSSGARRTP